ncbi:RNA-binding domain-containing protein [Serendipita vermifera]|nr:RNA-binding domain-containing protein [Serendipita vermifera]
MSNPFYPVGKGSKGLANQFSSNPYALAQGSTGQQQLPANLHEYDIGMYEQASAYVPGAAIVQRGASGSTGGHLAASGSGRGKKTTVVRRGGGKTWEDQTLLEWDPTWFRLFVGDVSNDVSDQVLSEAFNKYPSFTKAKVIRDKLSSKAKFGFVAFSDPEDFLKAWKEMDGKYVGNRPIRLKKADSNVRAVDLGKHKQRALQKEIKASNRLKPY